MRCSSGRPPANSGCSPAWAAPWRRPSRPTRVRAVARAALAALPVPPLYARIDGVETAAGFQIMEVEVNEPGLFFPHAPDAAVRFAEALLRRL